MDKQRRYAQKYHKQTKVKRARAQKLIEKLKSEKQKQLKDQLKGFSYKTGIKGPNKENGSTVSKNVTVFYCRHCGEAGHKMRTNKKCKLYKQRTKAVVESAASKDNKKTGKYDYGD